MIELHQLFRYREKLRRYYSSFFFAIFVLDLHLLDQMTLVVARFATEK
jgi:hypothetical protein